MFRQSPNEYAGSLDRNGSFAREIRMSEVFYAHLIEHAVPLNEIAIRELKAIRTAFDLYTYLAHRLPPITSGKGHMISWDQLAKHLGNEADSKRFRQTVRETMQIVAAVFALMSLCRSRTDRHGLARRDKRIRHRRKGLPGRTITQKLATTRPPSVTKKLNVVVVKKRPHPPTPAGRPSITSGSPNATLHGRPLKH
jgi:Plasmid encoded RepA protein